MMRPLRPAGTRPAALIALALALASQRAFAGGADTAGAPWLTQIDLTRATGMAGAMMSFASGNDALTCNPAGLAQNRAYHFQLDGMDDVKFPAEGVIVSVADSTTAAGVGSGMIFERWGAGQLGSRGEGWLGGLSYAYATGALLMGGTTHLIHFQGPGGETIHDFAEDLGVMGRAGSFQFGAVLQNINFTFTPMPLFPLTGGLGISYGSDTDWHLAADYKVDLSDTSNLKNLFAFGGEYLFDKTFVLRSGYRLDSTNHIGWLTFGASVVTEKFAFGVALRRRVRGGNMEQALEANITVYLE